MKKLKIFPPICLPFFRSWVASVIPKRSLYGNIIYNILGREQYIRYINQSDATVKKALDILERGEAFPKAPEATPIIEDKKDDGKEKRTAQAGSFVEDPTQLFRYASVC